MKKKGKGMALVLHPTGNKGAGDAGQAAVQLKPDGTFTLIIGTADLGQGSNTILRQFAADSLDVPIESISVNNSAGNIAPVSWGSFASRVTLVDPHAVVLAAEDLKRQVCEWAAGQFRRQGRGGRLCREQGVRERGPRPVAQHGRGRPRRAQRRPVHDRHGRLVPGTYTDHDPVTGEMPSVGAISFGTCYVEIEVDTETGVVDLQKLVQVWEVGKAVNPLMVKMQINGGLNIGLGYALSENCLPLGPSDHLAPENLADYYMPTFADYPRESLYGIEEVPHPMGVKGAKGFSEGSSTGPIPAIIAAIHDALGVWITEVPATPEVILRALEMAK